MKLNERGAVIAPNVHDAELVRMDFDSRWIDLHVKLALGAGNFILRLINPRWMSFSTNHSQNVIDQIVVTADLMEAAALAPKHIREMLWIREQTIPGQTEKAKPLKAIHITPTAGPELTCIADDVTGWRRVNTAEDDYAGLVRTPVGIVRAGGIHRLCALSGDEGYAG